MRLHPDMESVRNTFCPEQSPTTDHYCSARSALRRQTERSTPGHVLCNTCFVNKLTDNNESSLAGGGGVVIHTDYCLHLPCHFSTDISEPECGHLHTCRTTRQRRERLWQNVIIHPPLHSFASERVALKLYLQRDIVPSLNHLVGRQLSQYLSRPLVGEGVVSYDTH